MICPGKKIHWRGSFPQRPTVSQHGKTPPERPYVGVIDDDEPVLDSIRILLESHSLKVAVFNSAEAALQSPLLGQCHCFIVDMELLGMNGLQFVETIRKSGDQTPAIIIAANPHFPEPDRIRKNNILAFLVKPVPQNELLAWIRHSQNA
jgi:FixJ family two-component response regulator